MKKFVSFLLSSLCMGIVGAQNVITHAYTDTNQPRGDSISLYDFREAYIDVILADRAEVQQLANHFSIDKVELQNGQYKVRLWLGNRDYAAFINLGIPYQLSAPDQRAGELTMATTLAQMDFWNRYPTYSVYCEMMERFQTQYPGLCRIDTILAQTPHNHAILACYIGTNMDGSQPRPQFWYSSSIHGDEQCGFVMMLRLIDYLLSNYSTDSQVQNILNHIDVWISPVENPDGMYALSNNSMGGWSHSGEGSTRGNANDVDLNRSYPSVLNPAKVYEPEIQAMMDFASQHRFVMSANLHGGSELMNFPWDSWTTSINPHADIQWWNYVCGNFANTCHQYGEHGYFTEEQNGVTPGGDWYVITGSRQDYMTYYQSIREVTIEISNSKSPSGNSLPQYWASLHHSLLDYIEECLYGFSGTVTDSLTGEPLEARIYIENHDVCNSEVYSDMSFGQYYRPVRQGTYVVKFSADGYTPKTLTLSTTDGQILTTDVQLAREAVGVKNAEQESVRLYPNPASSHINIDLNEGKRILEGVIYNAAGQCMKRFEPEGKTRVDVSSLPAGSYVVRVGETSINLLIRR